MPTIGPISDDSLSVVMVQFDPHPAENHTGIEKNIDTICDYVDRATFSFPHVDLIVFPEYSTTGFSYKYMTHFEFACTLPGPETEKFQIKAKEKRVWMCVSMIECSEGDDRFPYNAQILIDDRGEIVHKYRKVNPWVPKEPWSPGSEVGVCDGPKGSRLAIILCYDADIPEPARDAVWKGANIILRPSKYMYPWDSIWEVTNRCRAIENNVYVVAVNTVGQDRSFSYFGHSMAVDYDGRILAEMGETEGMTKVDLFPNLVEEGHRKWYSNNNLLNLKHRGYTGVPPDGVRECPYSIYRDWDRLPEKWSRIPDGALRVAREQKKILDELQKKK
jgi:amidase